MCRGPLVSCLYQWWRKLMSPGNRRFREGEQAGAVDQTVYQIGEYSLSRYQALEGDKAMAFRGIMAMLLDRHSIQGDLSECYQWMS